MACSEIGCSRLVVCSGSGDRRDVGSGWIGGVIGTSPGDEMRSSLAGKCTGSGCCEGLWLVLCERLACVECVDAPGSQTSVG